MARASAFQAEGRGFESRFPLYSRFGIAYTLRLARVAQSAERVLGKDEVTGSSPVVSSRKKGPDKQDRVMKK